MGEEIGWITFIILFFSSPIIIMVANVFILKNAYNQAATVSITKKDSLKCSFLQHISTWIVVTVLANVINDSGFDGLSVCQSILLLVVGIAIYVISGQFLLKKILPSTTKILKIHIKTTVQLIIFMALYIGLLFIFGNSLPALMF